MMPSWALDADHAVCSGIATAVHMLLVLGNTTYSCWILPLASHHDSTILLNVIGVGFYL